MRHFRQLRRIGPIFIKSAKVMTPENQTPEFENQQTNSENQQFSTENSGETTVKSTEKAVNQGEPAGTEREVPEVEHFSVEETTPAQDPGVEGSNVAENTPEHQADVDTQVASPAQDEKILSEIDPEKASDKAEDQPEPSVDHRSVDEIVAEMEKLVNSKDAGAEAKAFNTLKTAATLKMTEEAQLKNKGQGADELHEDTYQSEHPAQSKINALSQIFREKYDAYLQEQEKEHAANLESRKEIIEKLKNLYTNTEPGTNLFKAIREIKELWSNAGKVAKNEFKLLNNDYFHHLNQFYAMLDMNKEYLEQEYTHNLEKRQHIIKRAQELENEPSAQKALNELQYLHKLWKEEAEPVAEEFREKTWEEFKEISNRIHGRKAELSASMEAEQNVNLEKKNSIIQEIKALAAPAEEITHAYWLQAIKKVEELRDHFLKTGSVPRKLSNQNWNDFKQTLREFNTSKNDFYKNLKGSQATNLEKKQSLIQTAKDNMMSEDWETAVPLFKKLQEEWKTIGHVPRNQANKVWDEFREACNTFFDNYRSKSGASTDNWKDNYRQKKALIDELKEIQEGEDSVQKIQALRNRWNEIGKVPKDKISINTEFSKLLKEKLRLNNAPESAGQERGSESHTSDQARKVKSQIADLENEIATLENNLGFFSNSSRENPLLKDTYSKIDEKKQKLETMKQNLHQMIKGE